MVFLAPPKQWRLWFGWTWFIEPSGGHQPPWTFWQRVTEGPLLGHAFGSFLAWGIGTLVWRLDGWPMWWWIVFLHALWQAFNVERRAYQSDEAVGQAFWRIVIGAVVGSAFLW